MTKKELENKQQSLKKMEADALKYLSASNGDLFRAAESLNTIKSLELFKAPRTEGKMTYRTFNTYLDHFNLSPEVKKIMEKLVALIGSILENKKLTTLMQYFPGDVKFWAEFFKVKEAYWLNVVERLEDMRDATQDKYWVDDIHSLFDETPNIKVGYSEKRASTIPAILGMINHLSPSEIEEFGNVVENSTLEALNEFDQALTEKYNNGTLIYCGDRDKINESTLFTVIKRDDKFIAERGTTLSYIGKMFFLFCTMTFLVGGVVGGVLVKYWPSIIAMFK